MFSLSVPVPAEYREKERELKEIISQKKQLSVEQLRHYAKSPGGFVTGKYNLDVKIICLW